MTRVLPHRVVWSKRCPLCRKRALDYAMQEWPHMHGQRDYSRARCRECRAVFRVGA